MSVLDGLDATRLCAHWSEPLADPSAWVTSAPVALRREPPTVRRGSYSWWSLARNPHAMLVTGMVGAVVAKDSVLRLVKPGGSRG